MFLRVLYILNGFYDSTRSTLNLLTHVEKSVNLIFDSKLKMNEFTSCLRQIEFCCKHISCPVVSYSCQIIIHSFPNTFNEYQAYFPLGKQGAKKGRRKEEQNKVQLYNKSQFTYLMFLFSPETQMEQYPVAKTHYDS